MAVKRREDTPKTYEPCPHCDGNCDMKQGAALCGCCDPKYVLWPSDSDPSPNAPAPEGHLCGFPCYPRDYCYTSLPLGEDHPSGQK